MITERELIELLTKSRFKEFKDEAIKKFTIPEYKKVLSVLISKYTLNIIKATITITKCSDLSEPLARFRSTFHKLSEEKNPQAMITLSNHILQYHNILLTTPDSENIINLFKFLKENQKTIGVWQHNPLLLRHLLITTYNSLTNIIVSTNSDSQSTEDTLNKLTAILNFLMTQINTLTCPVSSPKNNIYYSLLEFMAYYTRAKLYEAYSVFIVEEQTSSLKKTTSQNESTISSDIIAAMQIKLSATEQKLNKLQSESLKSAKNTLKKIQTASDLNSGYGHEYCLGMSLLQGLPFQDLDSLSKHVKKLTIK